MEKEHMRKFVLCLLAVITVAAALFTAYRCGICHVIRDADFWTHGDMVYLALDGDVYLRDIRD